MRYSYMLLGQYADPYNVKGVIPTLINERYPKFITLGRSASYLVKNWELGQHGDIGSNGSRGSLLQFRKLNTKIIVITILLDVKMVLYRLEHQHI
jgi:hypothetical protein